MAERSDWEEYLDAMAPAVDLAIDPAWRPGTLRFLGLASEMAARIQAVDLPEDEIDLDGTLVLPEVPR